MSSTDRARDPRQAWWIAIATLIAAVWTISACGTEPSEDPGASSSGTTLAAGDAATASGSSSGATASGSTSSGSTSGGDADADADADAGASSGTVPGATPPNFKVAFIGDTGAGADFKDVLALIKREKAQLVLVQGDVEYSGDTAADWLPVIDGELDTATTKIPYFVSRGNHDDDWEQASGLGKALDDRLTKWGITPDNGKAADSNYAILHQGLRMVFVDESETNPNRAEYVKARLANDEQIWKICSWHKNMRDSNVGPKSDEMGWQIYENCRNAGAIVAQGHSHTYSRSKTLVGDANQTLDKTSGCTDAFSLCVGPGKHFFFDSSVGGQGLRALEETNKPHWASFYAADYGALFIEFFVDGDPKKAKGYFKNVNDVIIDPPANSGKTFFTITSSN